MRHAILETFHRKTGWTQIPLVYEMLDNLNNQVLLLPWSEAPHISLPQVIGINTWRGQRVVSKPQSVVNGRKVLS